MRPDCILLFSSVIFSATAAQASIVAGDLSTGANILHVGSSFEGHAGVRLSF